MKLSGHIRLSFTHLISLQWRNAMENTRTHTRAHAGGIRVWWFLFRITSVYWSSRDSCKIFTDGISLWLHQEERGWVYVHVQQPAPSPDAYCSAGPCGPSPSLYWSAVAGPRGAQGGGPAAAGGVTPRLITPSPELRSLSAIDATAGGAVGRASFISFIGFIGLDLQYLRGSAVVNGASAFTDQTR